MPRFQKFEYIESDYANEMPPRVPDTADRVRRLALEWPADIFIPPGSKYEYYEYAHPNYPPLPGATCRTHVWLPAAAQTPVIGSVLWIHGINEFAGRYANICGIMARAGLAVVAPDQPGCGFSDGPPSLFTELGQWLATAAQAQAYRVRRWPGLPTFVAGHSLGGLVTAVFAAICPAARTGGVILTAAALSVSRTVYSGFANFVVKYLIPPPRRPRMFVPCVPGKTLRRPLPPELQCADRLNPLMTDTTNVASVYTMMLAGAALSDAIQQALFERARRTVSAAGIELLDEHLIPKEVPGVNERCCRCDGCPGCSVGRTHRRRYAKHVLRSALTPLYGTGLRPFQLTLAREIRRQAAQWAIVGNEIFAADVDVHPPACAVAPEAHPLEELSELVIPGADTEVTKHAVLPLCEGPAATVAPLRSQVSWREQRRLTTGRGSIAQSTAPSATPVFAPPPRSLIGPRIIVVHGTGDYVCPSTALQEELIELAGGPDWEGDAPLTLARERVRAATGTLLGTEELAPPEERAETDPSTDPLIFLAQTQLAANRRNRADRPFWHVRGGRHELYRDQRRWREIGEGITEWCTDKCLRLLASERAAHGSLAAVTLTPHDEPSEISPTESIGDPIRIVELGNPEVSHA